MPPSLPIPPRLAALLLEALTAITCGHQPTIGDRRRAASLMTDLQACLNDFEEADLHASLRLRAEMAAHAPTGPVPESLPITDSPLRRGGQPSGLRALGIRPARHAAQARPVSDTRHRAPARNLCPCCGRRIPRNLLDRVGQSDHHHAAACPGTKAHADTPEPRAHTCLAAPRSRSTAPARTPAPAPAPAPVAARPEPPSAPAADAPSVQPPEPTAPGPAITPAFQPQPAGPVFQTQEIRRQISPFTYIFSPNTS